MSERIGILTFHKAVNYGAALQAYVLSDRLCRQGYDAEIVDFLPEGHLNTTEMFVKPVNRGMLKHDLRTSVFFAYLRKREKSFLAFAEKYLKSSERKNIRYQELAEAVNCYDAVICGSDQIWNPRLSDADIGYFLPFALNCRRIAYGISLGNGYLSEYPDPQTVRKAIQDFDCLSFREHSAVNKLQHFIGSEADADIVCDPTLLEGREFWLQTAAERQVKDPYVFAYTANGDRDVFGAAERLSAAEHLPYYVMLSGKQDSYWKGMKRHLPPGEQGPAEFLAMIRYAEYVVTNSFHGAVFAILFGKKFCLIGKPDTDGKPIRDERLQELLSRFHLEDHYVTAENVMRVAELSAPDAEETEMIREVFAQHSADYLRKALADKTKHAGKDLCGGQEICPDSLCTSCGACRNICPVNAVKTERTEDGRFLPRIDTDRCIHCDKCRQACPVNSPKEYPPAAHVYAAQWKNRERSILSATSGVAMLIAEKVIEQGGIVYGAGVGNDLKVRHYRAENVTELEGMRTSRYAQSDTGYTYREIREKLTEGRQVLFIGTPCQNAALRNMTEDAEKLLCIDLVCHGTPPMSYLLDHLKAIDAGADNYTFRGGAADQRMTLKKDGQTVYNEPDWKDTYYYCFNQDISLAENCYSCRYASLHRTGDITLGDFWGLHRESLKQPMEGRVSLVMVNTAKGEQIFREISNELIFEERTAEEAAAGYYNLIHPTRVPAGRASFMDAYRRTQNFETAFTESASYRRYRKNLLDHTLKCRILNKAKRTVKKILRIG